MNVERNKSAVIKFGSVKPGDIFDIGGSIYMKMNDNMSENNAVDLSNGSCRHVEDTAVVTELVGTLKVR